MTISAKGKGAYRIPDQLPVRDHIVPRKDLGHSESMIPGEP
jgi:hypothetical protein